ncbi:universal stress protein [Nonomuraea sp. NPDC048882]|uniref:universal stress protein n=1 Tax=Nonomuraea sp. NPDC048882 TaxID=3154347 RepID=UPI000A648205
MTRPIVVGVDGSLPSAAAVEWAAAEAGRRGLGLRLVHVYEERPYDGYDADDPSGPLAIAADRARGTAPGVEVATRALPGNVRDVLIGESVTADTVVLGSRGLGGFTGMVIGSVSTAVAGHASGPVVVVHGRPAQSYGRVVIGYDRSPYSEAAMEYAVEQARVRGVPLHAVHAWQTPVFAPQAAAYNTLLVDVYQEESAAVAESVARWREKNPDVEITHETVSGHPVSVLAAEGATADLVVVGSRGHSGLVSVVLGSVSHGVLHHVTCPVAVVRPR